MQFGYIVLTTSAGIMDHEEARRKNVGGKVLGFFYWSKIYAWETLLEFLAYYLSIFTLLAMEIMFFFVPDDYIYIAYFFCYASSILCLNANLRFWLLDPSFAIIVLPRYFVWKLVLLLILFSIPLWSLHSLLVCAIRVLWNLMNSFILIFRIDEDFMVSSGYYLCIKNNF